MNLGEVIKIAWKSLTSNKLRSLLTMLGVIIGVAAVIMMIAISAGTEATIADRINGLGSNLLFINAVVHPRRAEPGPQNQKGGLVYHRRGRHPRAGQRGGRGVGGTAGQRHREGGQHHPGRVSPWSAPPPITPPCAM